MRAPLQRHWHVVIAIVAVAAAVTLYITRVSSKMPDFEVYHRAAERALAGEPLYRVDDGHYQLKYLPAFAVLLSPLGAFDLPAAKAIWFAITLAAVGLLVWSSVRFPETLRVRGWVLVAIVLIVMGKFYARELTLGQVNALLGTCVTFAVLAVRGGRDGLAGCAVAAAVVLKPYAVIMLPWLAGQRRPRAVAAALMGLGAAALVPLLRYGPRQTLELHRDWWDTVRDSTAPNLSNPDNVSWMAMYVRWFDGAERPAWALSTLTVVVALAVVAWAWGRRGPVPRPEGLEGALLLLLVPLISPQGWDYVLLLGTPAVVVLVNHHDRLPPGWRVATATAMLLTGLTLYDVMGRAAYHTFLEAAGLTWCAMVMAGGLVRLRLSGAA